MADRTSQQAPGARVDEGRIEAFPKDGGDLFVHSSACEGGCDFGCGVFVCGECGHEWNGQPADCPVCEERIARTPAPSPAEQTTPGRDITRLLKDYAGAVIAGVHEGNWYGTDEGAMAARDRVLAEVASLRSRLEESERQRAQMTDDALLLLNRATAAEARASAAEREAKEARGEAWVNEAKYHGAVSAIPVVVKKETERLTAALADLREKAGALLSRYDFWNALRREERALPGEYDDLDDALRASRDGTDGDRK